jgi:ACS family tartrate transporter-like MFS transporter
MRIDSDRSDEALVSSRDAAADLIEGAVGASAQRKASVRLLPLMAIGYGLAYMDRINISFASLQMNRDLHLSAAAYGLGAGLFFIGYAVCEVPSNLLMLRFGAKRWLARIMFTWGLLAAAMMLVRTPWEFYAVRFLLGVAEAGFFPGVIYYLTLWFPARARARAVSRFYIALPLASTVMGSLAGWLLGLGGTLGLAGWQWLFLVEGLPSVVFSFVLLRLLPNGPGDAAWLTAAERAWLKGRLEADGAKAHLGHESSVMQAVMSPKVWMIGGFFFCALTCSYGYSFSAPAILQRATGWTVAEVGYLVAGLGLAGAAAMLGNGAHSDRKGERRWHVVGPCLLMGAAYLTASYAHAGWLTVAALGTAYVAFMSMQGPALAVPTEFLAGRAAAAGVAAMNTITMFSGFVGPVWMGWMKDATGSDQGGLRGLLLPSLAAAGLMWGLTRGLERRRPLSDQSEICKAL